MTPGYAEVTFTIDFEIFSFSQVSQVVHANFTSVHSVHLIPCTNNNKACLIFYVSVNSKPDYPPWAIFFDG